MPRPDKTVYKQVQDEYDKYLLRQTELEELEIVTEIAESLDYSESEVFWVLSEIDPNRFTSHRRLDADALKELPPEYIKQIEERRN